MRDRTKILHPITRLIIGGAQENTILTAELLPADRWDVDVICGPQTGPEGSLIDVARAQGVSLIIEPSLVREINPLKDPLALFRLTRLIRRGGLRHRAHPQFQGRHPRQMGGKIGRNARHRAHCSRMGTSRPPASGRAPDLHLAGKVDVAHHRQADRRLAAQYREGIGRRHRAAGRLCGDPQRHRTGSLRPPAETAQPDPH